MNFVPGYFWCWSFAFGTIFFQVYSFICVHLISWCRFGNKWHFCLGFFCLMVLQMKPMNMTVDESWSDNSDKQTCHLPLSVPLSHIHVHVNFNPTKTGGINGQTKCLKSPSWCQPQSSTTPRQSVIFNWPPIHSSIPPGHSLPSLLLHSGCSVYHQRNALHLLALNCTVS